MNNVSSKQYIDHIFYPNLSELGKKWFMAYDTNLEVDLMFFVFVDKINNK